MRRRVEAAWFSREAEEGAGTGGEVRAGAEGLRLGSPFLLPSSLKWEKFM